MSYLFEFFGIYIVAAAIFQIAVVLLLLWGFMNEEKVIAFEDKMIRLVVRHFRRHRFSVKARLLIIARKAFVVCYGEVRRLRVKRCRKVLSRYGMKAVRSNSEFGVRNSEERYEVLP